MMNKRILKMIGLTLVLGGAALAMYKNSMMNYQFSTTTTNIEQEYLTSDIISRSQAVAALRMQSRKIKNHSIS